MFRWLGRLLRAWEMYNFIRYFSPMGYVMDKGMEYVLGRMRTGDWMFVSAAGLLALVWLLELINWPIQIILAMLRATGLTHTVWPGWPILTPLALPGMGQFLWWLLCGLFWLMAAALWLAGFVRRLWPHEHLRRMQHRVQSWRNGASFYEVVYIGPDADGMERQAAEPPERRPPRGTPMLVLAWLCQVFFWV